jgi:hypothetical protein
MRGSYRVWEEGRAPDLVIEVTSESTREEDLTKKFAIYRDILKVSEYFLFDPYKEYLLPPFQGFRLVRGVYRPIKSILGRLPSKVLGLHLEAASEMLRLYDPSVGRWLETPPEVAEARVRAEAERAADAKARQKAEAEVERLHRELDELRRRLPGSP